MPLTVAIQPPQQRFDRDAPSKKLYCSLNVLNNEIFDNMNKNVFDKKKLRIFNQKLFTAPTPSFDLYYIRIFAVHIILLTEFSLSLERQCALSSLCEPKSFSNNLKVAVLTSISIKFDTKYIFDKYIINNCDNLSQYVVGAALCAAADDLVQTAKISKYLKSASYDDSNSLLPDTLNFMAAFVGRYATNYTDTKDILYLISKYLMIIKVYTMNNIEQTKKIFINSPQYRDLLIDLYNEIIMVDVDQILREKTLQTKTGEIWSANNLKKWAKPWYYISDDEL